MKIIGLDGLSDAEIRRDLENGARFVIYQYCVSLVFLTVKRPSSIYFIRPGRSAAAKGLGFTALSLLLGWWGIPWGPIYTVQSVWANAWGGRDVTKELVSAITAAPAQAAAVLSTPLRQAAA